MSGMLTHRRIFDYLFLPAAESFLPPGRGDAEDNMRKENFSRQTNESFRKIKN